ncbi:MAG TPA: pirin family protein [Gammaproteobacteria bacterium]|nr:pirin family protein [Gammaproteobacteria bacterium]
MNLATVTYLLDGDMLHQDSIGSVQSIHPGDLNLMVAGSSIVHSERQSTEV